MNQASISLVVLDNERSRGWPIWECQAMTPVEQFHALPSSVLKLETSCQKENYCQGHSHTSWPIGFRPRMHARAWSPAFCFDCLFHNSVIFWSISTFFGPKYMTLTVCTTAAILLDLSQLFLRLKVTVTCWGMSFVSVLLLVIELLRSGV